MYSHLLSTLPKLMTVLSIVKGDEQDQVAEADAGAGSGPGGVSDNHLASPAYADRNVVACLERP